MRCGTAIQSLAVLAIGSALGYSAATTGRATGADAAPALSNPIRLRDASSSPPQADCSPSDLRRGQLLALATRDEAPLATAVQAGKKPNILVIFGDDIGQTNVSAYSMGLMGYRTPNIDRIAREGMIFTDYYAEQSCTAGRSSFITGQCTFRTGLSKVGMPAAPVGLQKEDPTIAELLKPLGYATAQFG
jgi:hypothetical protein